jgi:leucyl aminopeptidase (aminopeptidase T)
MEQLSKQELVNLISSAFPRFEDDKILTILSDIPEDGEELPYWTERREIAKEWYLKLNEVKSELNLDKVQLIAYRNPGANNADIPTHGHIITVDTPMPSSFVDLEKNEKVNMENIYKETNLIMALTQFSTTAPLKMACKEYTFRAATMPHFNSNMIPALRIDYNKVAKQVDMVKERLDPAIACEATFEVKGKDKYNIYFDLRDRKAHASAGYFKEPQIAGNLPSGEAYIVPNEGENIESKTSGTIPVQFADEIVLYRVEKNKAVEILSHGPMSQKEEEYIKNEPAYSNIAELGFGVLGNFNLKATGQILLDEKLGFHVAFGRSEHFGGQVGPNDFSSPDAVIHIDRIYTPEMQADVIVKELYIVNEDNSKELIIENNEYTIFE